MWGLTMALFDTDPRLVEQAKNGYAAPLYNHLQWPLLMWYVSKGMTYNDAEDLASVLWITVLGSIQTVDGSKPFAPWFTTLALNKLRNYHRDDRRRIVFLSKDAPGLHEDQDLMDVFVDPGADPLEVLEARELSRSLEREYYKMSLSYREALRLRVSGYSGKEITTRMGWQDDSDRVRRMVYKARVMLRG